MMRKLKNPCMASGRASLNRPGKDHCEGCGRVVLTRKDGTYQPHNKPTIHA